MARNLSVENHISADPKSWSGMQEIVNKERNSVFLYISYSDRMVSLWVLKANGDAVFRQSEEVDDKTLMAEDSFDLNSYFNKSIRGFGVLPTQKCEDQSFNETMPILNESEADLRGDQAKDTETMLFACSKLIIAPVAELLTEPEIIIVPERSLYRVPFAALRDQPGGKSLSETFRLRIVPSLSTLRLFQDCPADYLNQTGAMVVGNPKVGRARYRGEIHHFKPLACAEKEAEMIGQLLGVQPLLGERATREAVLQEISSVSLIHIAAHGNADRGEIALSPSPVTSNIPEEEDYLLRISDISQVKLRAKLVVLSCCHSGRGEIKVEGVIGIARAFLASGARSVLVTLWAIEDEATEQFMRRFYRQLVDGFSASECLRQAMKWLRNIGYTKVSQWAPFMLIGDNVTFNFKEERKDELEKEGRMKPKGNI
ncbi:tetratricopeptide repeat protein 28-like [Stylophora pistillata]|nr:tetratricopeptide repeat protein 28-like [Stylophora pistillata]